MAKQGAYYYLDRVSLSSHGVPLEEEEVSEDLPSKDVTYELGEEHTFRNVLFDFDQYQLDEVARKEVFAVYTYLEKNPAYQIRVHGHTDNVGTNTYNQRLSERRSRAVAKELIRLGLAKTRVSWTGKGGREPVTTNDTEAGRKQNRRVSFILNK
jgi:outer membrane protein OmpA-like peptidoglycan-associated protein